MFNATVLGVLGIVLLLAATTVRRFIFEAKLRQTGRWLQWKTVSERLRSGQGFLIVNFGTGQGRFWWIESQPDDRSLEELLWNEAYLTNCPVLLRSVKKLSRIYPGKVLVTNERSFS